VCLVRRRSFLVLTQPSRVTLITESQSPMVSSVRVTRRGRRRCLQGTRPIASAHPVSLTNERDSPSELAAAVAAIGNQVHDGKAEISSTRSKGKFMAIVTLGSISPRTFCVHAWMTQVVRCWFAQHRSRQAAWLVASLPPCLIGMEAARRTSWARLFAEHGHTRLNGAQVRRALSLWASAARTTRPMPAGSAKRSHARPCARARKSIDSSRSCWCTGPAKVRGRHSPPSPSIRRRCVGLRWCCIEEPVVPHANHAPHLRISRPGTHHDRDLLSEVSALTNAPRQYEHAHRAIVARVHELRPMDASVRARPKKTATRWWP